MMRDILVRCGEDWVHAVSLEIGAAWKPLPLNAFTTFVAAFYAMAVVRFKHVSPKSVRRINL